MPIFLDRASNQLTLIFFLVNWGNNTQGICIFFLIRKVTTSFQLQEFQALEIIENETPIELLFSLQLFKFDKDFVNFVLRQFQNS